MTNRVHELEWRESGHRMVAVLGKNIWTISTGWKGVWLGLDNGEPPGGNQRILIKWFSADDAEIHDAAKSLAQQIQDVIDGAGQ